MKNTVPPFKQIAVAGDAEEADRVYGLDEDGRVWCMRTRSGNPKWEMLPAETEE